MAKAKSKVIDVDFDDYDEKEYSGYDGDPPKRGIYDGALVSFKEHTSEAGNEGLEWIFEITEEPYMGWRGWTYSNMDGAKWKTQQITKAISGGAEKPTKLRPMPEDEDGSESPTVKKASAVRLVIRTEPYEGERRAKIGNVQPMDEDGGSKKGGKKSKKKGKKSKKTEEDPF